MKKFIFLNLLIFIFILSACSENSSPEALKNEPEKPVSDVTDTSGLKGTWATTIVKNDTSTEVILALNNNDTFEIWFKTDNDGEFEYIDFKGSFTDDGKNIVFTPDDPEEIEEETIGNGNFSYKLENDTLTLTNNKGEFNTFVREI